MNTTDYIIQLLDREAAQFAGAILTAQTETDTKVAASCQALTERLLANVCSHAATFTKDASWTLESVIDRLQKVNARPAVSRDAVASDNIRLACRALRRLIEQQETDNTPIDIFDI